MSEASPPPNWRPGTSTDLLTWTLYEDLREVARVQLRRGVPSLTLQATALVNEAWLRLEPARKASGSVGAADTAEGQSAGDPSWRSRQHFLAVAASVMRNILVDRARSRSALKRGKREEMDDLDRTVSAFEDAATDLVALNDCLSVLGTMDPQLVQIVELRFFAGLSIGEVARALGVSTRTVDRGWSTARAWLLAEMEEPGE